VKKKGFLCAEGGMEPSVGFVVCWGSKEEKNTVIIMGCRVGEGEKRRRPGLLPALVCV